jgi:hypothetical protein
LNTPQLIEAGMPKPEADKLAKQLASPTTGRPASTANADRPPVTRYPLFAVRHPPLQTANWQLETRGAAALRHRRARLPVSAL